MRKRLLLCGTALLVLFAISATPSYAACAINGFFTTPNLVFGPQAVGQGGLTQTATLIFSGCPGSATINSITISGANPGDFISVGNGATPCNVGSVFTVTAGPAPSCTLGTTFKPTVTGTRTATITVTYSVTGAFPGPSATLNLVGGDEIVYVSTQYGGQILAVDGIISGYFQVLYDGSPTGTDLNSGNGFYPEGLTIGPDSRLYVADPFYSDIWRLNLDGTDIQPVYQKFGSTTFPNFPNCNQLSNACPEAAQGPSFSSGPSFIASSGNGDLYFGSGLVQGEGEFTMPNVASTSDANLANLPLPPANIEPGSCNGCLYPVSGTATTFDSTGNLLAADNENNRVIILSPPYNSSTSPPTVLTSAGLSSGNVKEPLGLALNKVTGQMFLSDSSAMNIQAINSNGTTSVYYTFTSNTNCGNAGSQSDSPMFTQFDASGRLFVVTTTNMTANVANGCGKVWRIDPPGSAPICTESATPCPLVLVDLNQAQTAGIEGICTAPCGLNTPQAIGLALPPTPAPPQNFNLLAGGGSFTAAVPAGCGPLTVPCSSTYSVLYPAGMFAHNETVSVTFNDTTQALYSFLVSASNYSETTCAAVAGYSGDCLIPTAVVNCPGPSCPTTAGLTYQVSTTWQTTQTGYCTMPNAPAHLLRADLANGPMTGVPYTSVVDTILSCMVTGDPGGGTKGQSSCSSSTSSSSCLSDWPNATGPTTGSTSSTKVTASIASPSNGATFSLNGTAATAFSCSPATSPPVVACNGSVTQPDGTLVSVSSGGPLPTSQPGTYTLTVNAQVNGGAPPPTSTLSATEQYSVSSLQFIGFDAPITNSPTLNIAQAGQGVPVAFQVVNASGNPVTNLTMPPVSIVFAPAPCADLDTTADATIPVNASGNSGFQNLGGGDYEFVWKTAKSLSGTCGQLQVNLGDGVLHTADFKFK